MPIIDEAILTEWADKVKRLARLIDRTDPPAESVAGHLLKLEQEIRREAERYERAKG